jgi:hypothetical protein
MSDRFIPYNHCTRLGGDCFFEGRCLSRCRTVHKIDLDEQIETLKSRVLDLERIVYAKDRANG